MARVFVLGISVLDHVFTMEEIPGEARKFRADAYGTLIGGCAATAAVAITRLGGEARLATRLGDDANGATIMRELEAAGVDLAWTHPTAGAATPVSTVIVDRRGERQIVNYRGARLPDDAVNLSADAMAGCDALLTDTRWIGGAERAMELARAAGLPRIVDGEPPFAETGKLLSAATHLAFPRDGVRALSDAGDLADGLAGLASRYPAWRAVTDGANGTWFADGGGPVSHQPAFPIEARDSLGAGDVWHGAFALALAEARPESDAVRFASAAAALKCANGSGWQAIPDRTAVERLLTGADS